MALPYRYCVVNMLDLSLDIKNPRFASSTLVDNASKIPEEVDVIKHLLKYADVSSLASNIERTNCLHGSEMVTGYVDNTGKIVVAEGNRRVCACKLLLDRTLIPDAYKEAFPVASQETIENITSITINLYDSKELIQSYLSDRHISGVKKWSALEKNNYYMNLFQQYGTVEKVKTYTSDSLAVVKTSIKKYQFFMSVFKVLKQHGHQLEIEKIDYLPLVDRFMGILVGNDPDVGLGLRLDEERLVYLCPDNKKTLYEKILYQVGEAFLVRTTSGTPSRIVGTEIMNTRMRKEFILEDKRIPGLYALIKEYKKINDSDSNYSQEGDTGGSEEPHKEESKTSTSENVDFIPVSPERFIPSKYKTERLSFTQNEAVNFSFSTEEYDIKLQEILRELATIKIANDPVACACLYRCLIEMCARRVFAKNVPSSVRVYNEGNLSENLNYINNNIIFNGLSGSEWEKKKKAIKDKFGKDGLIDVLNMYIHYPQMVDVTYIVDSWTTMKIFVSRCLCV